MDQQIKRETNPSLGTETDVLMLRTNQIAKHASKPGALCIEHGRALQILECPWVDLQIIILSISARLSSGCESPSPRIAWLTKH